jgi:hypothetical protein
MAAAQWDIVIEEGSTFELTFQWKPDGCNPKNITGWWWRMHVKLEQDSASTLLYNANTSNGFITMTPLEGKIHVKIPVAFVDAPDPWTVGYYDLIGGPNPLDEQEDVKRLVEGMATWSPKVTS